MTFRPLQPTPTTTPQGGGFRALSSTPAQQPLGQLQQKTPLIEKSKGLGFGIGLGVAPIGLGGVSSFLGRASDKVKEATEKKSIIESDYKSGKQGAIQTNIQRAGAGVGLAYGIASELPIIKQGFELFGKGINKLSETAPIEKAGDFISPVTGFGLGLWDKLTPQQKRTAGAGAEILSSIPFGTPAKTAGIASKVAKPVIKGAEIAGKGTEVIKDTVRTSLKGYGDNIVEKQISKDLDTLLSKKGLQTQIKNTEKKNINITEHLSDREIFEGLKLEKGKINPTKSINVIDDRIDTILDAKSKMLPEIDRIVPKTPKDVIYRKAIADLKGTPADNLKTIKQIEVQLAPLPETLSVSAIDKFRALFRKSARDARGLQKDGSHYSALENATRDTVFDITDDLPMSNSNEFASLNTYVKDMIGTKEFIEKSLTGRVFDKGGMSYLFGKGIGAVAGSKFGIFGAIAGSEVGGTITSILASNHLGSSIKLKIIKNMTDDPRIIKEVERLLSDLKNYEPNFPLLGEGAIPLGAKQPLESSVKAIPATELKPDRLRLKEGATLLPPREASGVKAITPKTGLVGQDPKTGRFFGTLLGGEKTQSLGIPSISRQNTANTTITTVPKKVIPNTTIKTSTKSSLLEEAKKYKSADKFIEANIDSYTKTTKEYKDWAKGNKNIIEAYHGTPYSFDKFEIGKKQSGVYELDGISFASEKNLAEPFSRQFPDSYYDKKSMLDKKFPKVSETKSNLDKIEAQSKKRGTDSIKKEGKEVSDALKERLQKKKDMIKDFSDRSLNQDDLAKFKEENSYSYGRLRELENELKVSKNKKDIDVSLSDKKDLKIYNEELKKLENEVQGNIYKVYIKGKNIIDEVGEEIGFSGSRNDIVAQLDGDILRIKDADTGQYIGEEIIINDPKQVFIVNSPKTKSQLKDIYNKANKPLGDLTK